MKKLCGCGCGGLTKTITKTNHKEGRVNGEYNNFITGHNTKIKNPMANPQFAENKKQGEIKKWKSIELKQKQRNILKNYYKTHIHHTSGKPKTSNQKERMSLARKEWYKKNPVKAELKAQKCSETKIKEGTHRLERNKRWLGGKSFEPYSIEFNSQLKSYIRWMDNYICQQCGVPETELKYNLCIHHIDFNKKNNSINNLISLCKTCHVQTNFNRQDWVNYFQDKLNQNRR